MALIVRCSLLVALDENDVFEITEWVVGDFDTREGQELIVNALKHLVRIAPHPHPHSIPPFSALASSKQCIHLQYTHNLLL